MTLEELIDRIESRFREIRNTPEVLQKDLIRTMATASVMDTLDWAQGGTTPRTADASTRDAAQAS
jgi:hypothetical protein